MTTLFDGGFEGATGHTDNWDNFTGGGGAIDTSQFNSGAQSLLLNCTGAAKSNNKVISTSALVGRLYYRLETDCSAGIAAIQGNNLIGSPQIQLRVGRKMRCTIVGGTASAESSVMNLNQWYLIEWMFRTDSGTSTVAYRIEGVDQPGASRVQTADPMTLLRLGNTSTPTVKYYVDDLKLTDQVADYPLGALPVVAGGFPYVGAGYYPA